MYGYEKVIVVELKSEWDLAMRPGGEIIRIRKKQGLHTGDVIYILPEDIISQKNDNTLLFCAASQPSATQNQEAQGEKKCSPDPTSAAAVGKRCGYFCHLFFRAAVQPASACAGLCRCIL